MRKWKGWWIPTPVTGKEKDSWGCYATEQTEKCSEIQCQDCIYWNLDGQAEWRLKEYLKEHKQGKEQARDSKGRFCRKEEAESYPWEGLKVPVDPKREWGEWMCSNAPCPGFRGGVDCKHVCHCADCIYAWRHEEERRCFYEQWYGKYPISNNNELPELTATAFHCPDCPKEAELLFVMPDGAVFAFDKNVQYLATLELKCKFPGEVERQHKTAETRPHLVKPAELDWKGGYMYSPSTGSYYEFLPDGRAIALGTGAIFRLILDDAVPVGIEKYSPEELIGRSIKKVTPSGTKYDVITGITDWGAIITGTNHDGMTSDTLIRNYSFLDGSLLFKPVH